MKRSRIIAFDGQPFAEPRESGGIVTLSPAQRMDLAMRPEVTGTIPFQVISGEAVTFANFRVGDASGEDLPLTLPAPNALAEPDVGSATALPLVMAGGAMGGMRSMMRNGMGLDMNQMMQSGLFWAFNGSGGMEDKPMFTTGRGETVVIESRNDTVFDHAIHLHGHHFRILERNGRNVEQPDWHDTYTIAPEESVKIAFVADNPGKWLLHCHMLGHAASGMTTWFEVA